MDYLTIETVKEYLRLVDPPPSIIKTIEAGITKSEKTVYKFLGKSYSDLKAEYGEIPKNVKAATLILTEDYLRRVEHENCAVKSILEPYRK